MSVYMSGDSELNNDLLGDVDLGLDLSVLLSKMGVDEKKASEIFDIINRVDDPLIIEEIEESVEVVEESDEVEESEEE